MHPRWIVGRAAVPQDVRGNGMDRYSLHSIVICYWCHEYVVERRWDLFSDENSIARLPCWSIRPVFDIVQASFVIVSMSHLQLQQQELSMLMNICMTDSELLMLMNIFFKSWLLLKSVLLHRGNSSLTYCHVWMQCKRWRSWWWGRWWSCRFYFRIFLHETSHEDDLHVRSCICKSKLHKLWTKNNTYTWMEMEMERGKDHVEITGEWEVKRRNVSVHLAL